MELRRAADDDLPTMHGLFLRALGGVFEPHGFRSPAPRLDAFANQQRHILTTGALVVAEEGGRLVGFASAWQRDDHWYLASLFIDPPSQGRGLGAALLAAVWGGSAHRRTITDAIQPVSNVLYARRGLIPTTPVLTFTGRPLGHEPVAEPEPADLGALDAAAYGFDRSLDHAYWERHARRTTWPGAYSYVFPGGEIGPVAGIDAPSAARALAAELARADGEIRVRIPGSAPALVDVALAAGLRLDPVPGLLLLSKTVQPPTALSGYVLF